MKKSALILPLILLGCGSDHRGDTDTQNSYNNKYFSLAKVNDLTTGQIYSSELVNADQSHYGFLSVKNQQEEVLNGVLVTPQYRYLTITNQRYGSSNISAPVWETTSYIETATNNLISFKLSATAVGIGPIISCTSSSPYHLPDQVKLGDAESTPSFTCDGNITFAGGSWHTEAASEGNLNLIIKIQTLDQSSNIIDETTTYTIDPAGNILQVKVNDLVSFN